MTTGLLRLILMLAIVLLLAPVSAHPQTSQDFSQLVERLSANSGDAELRKRIIAAALTIKPAPTISEEARRAFIMGTTIAKTATTPSQQTLAVSNFQEAVKLAPWWGDAYYNLAITQELAEQFDAARTSLEFYILTTPGEAAAREAKDKIYAIEATQALRRQQLADAANAVESKVALERQFLASLEGVIWMTPQVMDMPICANASCSYNKTRYLKNGYSVRSGQVVAVSQFWDQGMPRPAPAEVLIEDSSVLKPFPLTSRRVQFRASTMFEECNNAIVQISEGARTLTITYSCSRYEPREFVRVN